MSEWVLKNIDPTSFNVASDVIAQIASGVLIMGLVSAYPYMVWRTVRRGKGVPLGSLISPPETLVQALMRFKDGGSWLFLLGVALVLLVSTFSHVAADAFLKFRSVQVSADHAVQLLGRKTISSPASYALIGDKSTTTVPFQDAERPIRKLQLNADAIARGLSRLSIVFETPLGTDAVVSDPVSVRVTEFEIEGRVRAFTDLGVQCNSNVTVQEIVRILSPGLAPSERNTDLMDRHVPDCDYELDISEDIIGDDAFQDEWRVRRRMYFRQSDDFAEGEQFGDVGFFDSFGRFSNNIILTQ